MERPKTLEELTRFMTEGAQMIGNDIFAKIQMLGLMVDAETGIENLGNNVGVNAAGFALDQILTEMAVKATGRDRKELFREISQKHQKCVHEILSEYSKSKLSIMIDLEKKEGT